MNSTYYTPSVLTTNVNISPNSLKADINNTLLVLLKQKYEGVCNKDGYIVKDSIDIVNRSIGEIKTLNNSSLINYNITYKCNIISPSIDNEYDSFVSTINKLGIISYIKFSEEGTIEESPFIIIIPKEYLDEALFDSITVGDKVKIKIKSFRVKYLSKQIQIVATIV
jgi:DNA-directed RNA polymerase subunit E'/Rpb7